MTYRTVGPSVALACQTWRFLSASFMPLLADKAERFVFASPLLSSTLSALEDSQRRGGL
jgi:hypothetical protein